MGFVGVRPALKNQHTIACFIERQPARLGELIGLTGRRRQGEKLAAVFIGCHYSVMGGIQDQQAVVGGIIDDRSGRGNNRRTVDENPIDIGDALRRFLADHQLIDPRLQSAGIGPVGKAIFCVNQFAINQHPSDALGVDDKAAQSNAVSVDLGIAGRKMHAYIAFNDNSRRAGTAGRAR